SFLTRSEWACIICRWHAPGRRSSGRRERRRSTGASRQAGAEYSLRPSLWRGDHEALVFGRPRCSVHADLRFVPAATGGGADAGHARGSASGAADADADAISVRAAAVCTAVGHRSKATVVTGTEWAV